MPHFEAFFICIRAETISTNQAHEDDKMNNMVMHKSAIFIKLLVSFAFKGGTIPKAFSTASIPAL